MSSPHATTIGDHVIDLLNRLRAGTVPENLLHLLQEMVNNRGDGAVSLPEKMKRICTNTACIEEAFELVKNNTPAADGARKPLANSMPLCSIARDIGTHLHSTGGFHVDAGMAMPIISKYLVARDNAIIGMSIVFTSTMCINSYGSDHNSDIAAHIISSLLIDEASPKHLNRAKVFDSRFCFVGVYNGPHKQFGNMTVIVYAQTVSANPTSPARAPAPVRTSVHAGKGASSPKPEDLHTITKITENAEKTAYNMELCPLSKEEFGGAELVKKGSYVILRHGGNEQTWRLPFPLTSLSSVTAQCVEVEGADKPMLSLKVGKELTDVPGGKLIEVVSENVVVPTNPSVPPKVRPQIKLKTSTAESIEASLGVCSSDVHVNVKLVRTEVARSNVLFEFQFQEATASGAMKTLKGNQTVRLPFVCSKEDIVVALEDGSLNVRIQAPKPAPFDPSEDEQPINRA